MYNPSLYPELKRRWTALQHEMARVGADSCLAADNVNLFYLSDRVYSGYCYLPVEGEPLFFVRRPVGLKGNGVHYIRKPEQIVERLQELGLPVPRRLLLELDELTYSEVNRLRGIFMPDELLNATSLLRKIRSVKSVYEIELLRQSARQHAACYAEVPGLFRSGMTDVEFSIEIERLFRQKGALGYFRVFGQSMELFMGSIIAGDNANTPSPYDFAMGGGGLNTLLPVGSNGTVLSEGSAVMVDMGGTFTAYMSDMTRVFSVGKLNPKAYAAHKVALEIQYAVEQAARPGVAACDLYQLAFDIAQKNNLQDYFMGHKQQAGFVGHGIGIQINEGPVLAPRSKDLLQEGHVFALEPKFVIPGTGAVGIENSYALQANGLEKLTVLNEEIVELE